MEIAAGFQGVEHGLVFEISFGDSEGGFGCQFERSFSLHRISYINKEMLSKQSVDITLEESIRLRFYIIKYINCFLRWYLLNYC